MEDATRTLAAQGLETLRGRLLDLTARNRLLNFPHGRQGNVRVVNELPHVLHQLLFGEDDVQIRAVPEPNREQLGSVIDLYLLPTELLSQTRSD